jgi:hypothetical protein
LGLLATWSFEAPVSVLAFGFRQPVKHSNPTTSSRNVNRRMIGSSL